MVFIVFVLVYIDTEKPLRLLHSQGFLLLDVFTSFNFVHHFLQRHGQWFEELVTLQR
jgi:hypothetical protein